MNQKTMSNMERIYHFVTAHPGAPATVIGDELGLPRNSGSSLVTQLEQRGVLKSEKTKSNNSARMIKGFSIAIPSYKLLPIPKNPKSDKSKAILPQAIQVPPIAVVPAIVTSIALTEATQLQLIMQFFKLQQAEVAKQVEDAIAFRIASAFENTPMAEALDDNQVQKKVEKPRSLTRFLLVGLLPAQAMIISQRLAEFCDMRFWQDDGTPKLRTSCGWADHVVTMTKFISHATEEVIKRTGKPLMRCNGGVTDLTAQIHYCLQSESKAK